MSRLGQFVFKVNHISDVLMNKSCSKQERSAAKMPSILNEVIGPMMRGRGPSSSHSAAAVRIGCIARVLMGNDIDEVLVEFNETGYLPTTYSSQGSDMGLCGGLLGFAASDEKLIAYREELDKSKIQISYVFGNYGDSNPNTYRLTLKNKKGTRSLVGISTGGGMIEIIEVDGVKLSIRRDLHETLSCLNWLRVVVGTSLLGGGRAMLAYSAANNLDLADLALVYESAWGG